MVLVFYKRLLKTRFSLSRYNFGLHCTHTGSYSTATMGAVLSLVCNHAPALNPTTSLPNRQLSPASVTSSSTGAGMEGGTLDISSVPNERVEGLAEEVALPSPVAADPRGTYSRLGHLYHLHPSDFIQQLLQNQGIN